MGEGKVATVLAAALVCLAGCGGERVEVEKVKVPVFEVTCPDPEARTSLSDGSTWRDLALSRSEALHGWRACHDALSIAQD
ncbi:hypothetical protein [Cereibacter azotoformans]|uniref:hypothetical protein n=1 Tax=Cereibacter azotoformans TaxID=43057 RepID=UPI0011B27D5C|nr:hypothetical protein [Cereibacter azotoformans]MBO4169568.1 hypothetical protein [Cereibacter azotoformans]